VSEQLVIERQKVKADGDSVPTIIKKKKRKHDKATSDKSDVGNSTQTDGTVKSVKVKSEFVPHDYGKADLKTLLQGTLLVLPRIFRNKCFRWKYVTYTGSNGYVMYTADCV